jgi:hypothetical protein
MDDARLDDGELKHLAQLLQLHDGRRRTDCSTCHR